jgi:hypothetical protein
MGRDHHDELHAMTSDPLDHWLQVRLETNQFSVQPGKAVTVNLLAGADGNADSLASSEC